MEVFLVAEGRYDELVRRFTGEALPAVGASVGVDRMFAALNHLGLIDNKNQSVADVLVLRLATDKDEKYLEIANIIRKSGKNVEVCLFSDTTFKNQFSFALGSGVRYVVICGEDEFAKSEIAVKDMQKRIQETIPYNKIEEYFDCLE
ncbi:TPA: hypothetical protein DDY55_04560 [Candidatus Falkowbacteria bacterium]|nr:hypothetical protein [Candidatus Falkowbacteria bacterium]